jgi:hypothetical protein
VACVRDRGRHSRLNRKQLLVLVGSLLLAPLAGEACARLFLRARGEPYDGAAVRGRFEAALAALEGDLLPDAGQGRGAERREKNAPFLHPFFGWEARPYHARLIEDVRPAEPGAEDFYTVVVLGGSVAGLFVEEGGGADALARDLEADPRLAGRPVRVLSHGRGAFKEPQQLFVLQWLFALGLEPDAVINIDGFNEVALSNQNVTYGAHPLYPSFSQWGPRLRANMLTAPPELFDAVTEQRYRVRAIAETALARGYSRSAVLGRFAVGRLEAADLAWQEAQAALLTSARDGETASDALGPPFAGGVEEVLDLAVRCWREASLDLEALCRRRSIPYLHVLQPTLHDEGSKPLTDEERRKGKAVQEWRDAARLGYPRLRAEGAALAAEGFPFLDASLLFAEVEDTLYYDACHFGRAGNELLAHAIAAAFLRALPP